MLRLASRLWRDEEGFVASSETVLLGTILVLGSIAGLVTVRDAVATEMGDMAHGLMSMNQSYSYAAVVTDCGTVNGSQYADQPDFCVPFLSDDSPPQLVGPIFINPGAGYSSGGTEQ